MFRSQTSDNMDTCSNSGGSSQGRERVRKKKMQVHEEVRSRSIVFFGYFVAQEGREVWEIKNCTPLRRDADVEGKMLKHLILRRTLLEIKMFKKCMLFWCEANLEVKVRKTPQIRSAFGSWDGEEVQGYVARTTFRRENVTNAKDRTAFAHWAMDSCDSAPCQKWAKRNVKASWQFQKRWQAWVVSRGSGLHLRYTTALHYTTTTTPAAATAITRDYNYTTLH